MAKVLSVLSDFPIYGTMGITGVLLGYLFLFPICNKRGFSYEDSVYVYTWASVGAIIGAKVLYIIQNIKPIILYLVDDQGNLLDKLTNLTTGGFVFYGGLFGAILGTILASKAFSISAKKQLNVLIPVLPRAHGFGRIGCYYTGCCFGITYNGPLSIHYTNSLYAPNHIGLFPIQLVECVFDFCLFILLFLLEIKGKTDNTIDIYLVSYASFRFLAEFVRGDSYRGFIYNLSFSQWISIMIILLELRMLLLKKSHIISNKE